jgi:hypothetical protein
VALGIPQKGGFHENKKEVKRCRKTIKERAVFVWN